VVPGYYAVMCAPTVAVFAVAWVVFGYVDGSWRQLFPATFPTLVCTQLSLIGHNAGHKQIFRGRRVNDAAGLVHIGLVGISYGWWLGKHNCHHSGVPVLPEPALVQYSNCVTRLDEIARAGKALLVARIAAARPRHP
jgi:fatty acid desaturase